MNYHQEGVFHADYVEWWACWRVYTDLTTEEIDNVEGTRVGRIGSDGKFGRQVYIDPRFSEGKVLGELMELAQRKYQRDKCTCHPHYHSDGSIDPVHFGDCPCRSSDECCTFEIKHVLCPYDTDREEIKVIRYRGKLYYVEGEAGPERVVVKQKDLDELEGKLNCSAHQLKNCLYDTRIINPEYTEPFRKGRDFLLDAQDLLSDIIVSSMETECV